MPVKTRATLSLKKVFLLSVCVLLGVVVYKINQAHSKLPGLLRDSLADLKLEDKGLKLSFEKASITLVSSLSHPLGLRLKGLQVEQTLDCKAYNLNIDTLVLPVKIMSLYKDKKINLGLVRLNKADLKNEDLCVSKPNKEDPTNRKGMTTPKAKVHPEKKILSFFQSLKRYNQKFVKQSQLPYKYKGFLIYDLSFEMSPSAKAYINRFKVLRGSGELKYKAEWDAELFVEESKVLIKGDAVGYEKTLESVVYFKEKESELKASLSSFSDLEKSDKLLLNFKSVPLSYLSKVRKADYAGLNLRKTWLDSIVNVEILSRTLKVEVEKFKIYGDFGLVETDANSPSLKWSKGSWSLSDSTQLKFQKINFFEILADRPQKKMSQVFKDVGSFNALVKLDSLENFHGDFETNDFSVSVRSSGRKAYQKIRFARGSVSYQKEKSLTFNLEDVDLENGDFDGYIKFIYDYEKKQIQTKFNLQHLKFDPIVTKKLLGLDQNQDFTLKGDGFISKSNLTKKNSKDYQSELKFDLSSKLVETEHWSSKNLQSLCNLKERNLSCDLSIERLTITEALKAKLELGTADFEKVKSDSFVFKKKFLTTELKSSDQVINVDWSSKEGVGVSTPTSEKILIRDLND